MNTANKRDEVSYSVFKETIDTIHTGFELGTTNYRRKKNRPVGTACQDIMLEFDVGTSKRRAHGQVQRS